MELLRDFWTLAKWPMFQAGVGWSCVGWALVYANQGRAWVALAYGIPGGVLVGMSLRKRATPPTAGKDG